MKPTNIRPTKSTQRTFGRWTIDVQHQQFTRTCRNGKQKAMSFYTRTGQQLLTIVINELDLSNNDDQKLIDEIWHATNPITQLLTTLRADKAYRALAAKQP